MPANPGHVGLLPSGGRRRPRPGIRARLDVSAQEWIARATGSDKEAATLRRFSDRPAAVAWLQESEPAPAVCRGRPVRRRRLRSAKAKARLQ